ncbi:gamma-glutamyl kinase [Lactobacillus delbrueckii subsp. bulgaricus]|nr:gamma-glutamyl kinase [Lactobacillus delbrueckii subsp. bulgaricus]
MADKQAAAAVGQGLLIEEYTRSLLVQGMVSAQILLTQDDFADQRRYQNAQTALNVLLSRRVIPIINENDTIAIDELKIGDNDTLSAQVASLLKADLLVLLTDVPGLYSDNPRKNPDARPIPVINEITPQIFAMAGGMATKIKAADMATKSGVPVFICSADSTALVDAVHQKGPFLQPTKMPSTRGSRGWPSTPRPKPGSTSTTEPSTPWPGKAPASLFPGSNRSKATLRKMTSWKSTA